jgi:hypothetical protein
VLPCQAFEILKSDYVIIGLQRQDHCNECVGKLSIIGIQVGEFEAMYLTFK